VACRFVFYKFNLIERKRAQAMAAPFAITGNWQKLIFNSEEIAKKVIFCPILYRLLLAWHSHTGLKTLHCYGLS
jgi:hypothetical protein